MKKLKLWINLPAPVLFLTLNLWSPLASAWCCPDFTAIPRWMLEKQQTIQQKAMLAKEIQKQVTQAAQLRNQIQQNDMYKVKSKFVDDIKVDGESIEGGDKLSEACKNGVGDGVCVIAMQKQKKAEGGSTNSDEATSEYSVDDYAAGSPHKRTPGVLNEMEKQHSATEIFLTKKYFVQLTAFEKEMRTLGTQLTSTSDATDVAVVNTKITISLGKLEVLTAQLAAIKTQLKLLDHKHQFEAEKQRIEATGRGKGS